MWATTVLMDLVGDYAQTTDCPLEKYFRDAKIYQLFEGTAQVQRLVIRRMQRADYRKKLSEGAEVLGPGAGLVLRRHRGGREGSRARGGVTPRAAGAGTEPAPRHNRGRELLARPRGHPAGARPPRRSTCARCACWRAAGIGVPAGQQVAWHAGVALTAIGLLSPLDALGEELLIAHMGQHLLIADLVGAAAADRHPLAGVRVHPAAPGARCRWRAPPGCARFLRWLRRPLVAIPVWIADPLRLAFQLCLRGRAAQRLRARAPAPVVRAGRGSRLVVGDRAQAPADAGRTVEGAVRDRRAAGRACSSAWPSSSCARPPTRSSTARRRPSTASRRSPTSRWPAG